MGNTYTKLSDSGAPTKGPSVGIIVAVIMLLALLAFGIAIIVTSRKKSGPTNACDTMTPPINVTVSSPIPGTINVSWAGVSGTTSYKVYRSSTAVVSSTSYDEVKTVTNGTSVNFTGLTSSSQSIAVTSVNSCGESAISAITSFEMNCILPVVSAFTLTQASSSAAIAAWTAVPFATGYKIFTLVNDLEATQTVAADVNSFTVNGSGAITVAVNAINACSEGPIAYKTITL